MVVRAILVVWLAAAPAVAQNFDHPGLVHAGKAGWVTPGRAAELGYFEYRGRWLPKKLRKRVAAWEKKDARVKGWTDAYKEKSKHYRIVTDVPRFILELEIKPFLDELYRTYVNVFKGDFGLSGRAANMKTIKIFNGYENYARNAERGEITPRSMPGFIVGGDELVVYYDDLDPGDFYSTVFHEGAHQFVSATLPGASLPIWLDEAMATYFEACTYSRATRKITIAHLSPERVGHAQRLLKPIRPAAGVSLPEKLFMRVPEHRFEAAEYALAWSFVYYLIHTDGGKHRKAFAKFLRATNGAGTRPVADIFKRATGMKLADLSGGWREYVMSLKAPPAPIWVVLEVGGEPDSKVNLKSGDFVVSIDRIVIGSLKQFEQVWTKRPAEATARTVEWVVLRREAVQGPSQYRQALVHTSVAPGTKMTIEHDGHFERAHNLRD